jgi:hypothetical protein
MTVCKIKILQKESGEFLFCGLGGDEFWKQAMREVGYLVCILKEESK